MNASIRYHFKVQFLDQSSLMNVKERSKEAVRRKVKAEVKNSPDSYFPRLVPLCLSIGPSIKKNIYKQIQLTSMEKKGNQTRNQAKKVNSNLSLFGIKNKDRHYSSISTSNLTSLDQNIGDISNKYNPEERDISIIKKIQETWIKYEINSNLLDKMKALFNYYNNESSFNHSQVTSPSKCNSIDLDTIFIHSNSLGESEKKIIMDQILSPIWLNTIQKDESKYNLPFRSQDRQNKPLTKLEKISLCILHIALIYKDSKLNPEKAYIALKQASTLNPYLTRAWYELALFEISLYENFKTAKSYLQKTIDLCPSFTAAHSDLSSIYMLHQQYKEALEILKRAEKIEPGQPIVQLNLGIGYQSLQEWQLCIDHFQRAKKKMAKDERIVFGLAKAFAQLEDWKNASNTLYDFLDLEPNHPIALSLLGCTLVELNKIPSAIEAFEDSLSIDPTDLETRNNLAMLYLKSQRYESSLGHYEKLIEFEKSRLINHNDENTENQSKLVQWHLSSAQIHQSLISVPSKEEKNQSKKNKDHIDKILDHCHQAIQLDTNCYEAHAKLGTLYQSIGLLDQSYISIQRAIQIKNNSVEMWCSLGKVFQEKERMGEAFEAFQMAFHHFENQIPTLISNSIKLLEQEDKSYQRFHQEFVEIMNTTEEKDKENVLAIFINLASLLKELQKYQQSETIYSSILIQDPKYMPALYNMANLYMSRGDGEEAICAYEKVIQLDPTLMEAHLNISKILVFSIRHQREAKMIKGIQDQLEKLEKKRLEKNWRKLEKLEKTGEKLEDLEKAEDHIHQVLKVDGYNLEALKIFGDLNLERGDYKKAKGIYDKIIKLGSNDGEIYLSSGICLYHLQQYQDAAVIIQKSIDFHPENEISYYYLSMAQNSMGKINEAKDSIKKLVQNS